MVSSRVFDAPREAVFGAFLDPATLARWWGPDGFSSTIQVFDPRPGGTWKLVMHAPNGTDYHNESVFVEVTPPELVVFDHLEPVHRFRMTMQFDKHEGGTLVTWRMRFDVPAECERVRAFVTPANEQNFDRLAGILKGG
ncbi:SRPBCC family protein [Limnoglobus roseus]|uniref:SRPBCC family protein n=1 Tax=Limnoglobus roseus TaxID=2598579 RepID=UPI0036F3AB39